MDINPQRRLPAFEDTEAYQRMCADRGTTPIQRPPGGQAYILPGLDDDPLLPFPLAALDTQARKFDVLRHPAEDPPPDQ